MFQYNPDLPYMMPGHFGIPHTEKSSLLYLDVTSIAVGYLTDREKLEQYIPAPFEIRGEPVVSVYYAMNREVEWLAGGGYNLLGVDVPVHFNGKRDQVDGSFNLVLWENDTDAIVSGRELLGVPKIFADIGDHKVIQGEWRTSASNRGQTIVDISVKGLEPIPEEVLQEQRVANADSSWLGYRYVPNIGGPGAALEEATCIPSGGSPREAWAGTGEVTWHRSSWERNPTQWHIMNALADLPILEYRWALVSKGGSTLADPNKKPLRTLR